MKYGVITSIAILVMSVATATLAISLLSQPAAAICAGTTCADSSGPRGPTAINSGAFAGTKASSTHQPSADSGHGTAAAAGSRICNGKPGAVNGFFGPPTCAP